MADQPARAQVRSASNRREVNVRAGPGTGLDLLFKVPVGTEGAVLEVRTDAVENDFQGKVYQWLRMRFEDGREGWVRDDLLDLLPGDFSALGYGHVRAQVYAFSLTRNPSVPPVTPEPPTPEPVEPVEPMEPVDVSGCGAIVIGARGAINVRSGPAQTYPVILQYLRGTLVAVLEVRADERGGALRWVRVDHAGRMGWVREDLLSFQGEGCVALGLLAPGLYPAPFAPGEYWWIRGFTGPQPDHPGWDLGALQSEPVLGGPAGGMVLTSFQAARPTPERPRTIDQGLTLGDPRVFSDPGWGFGYGHYVVVRYGHDLLPEATRRTLADRGMPGVGLAVLYAHLHERSVEAGAVLAAGQTVGLCGTTGNAEAPHLHLEVRAIRNPAETSWARLRDGLIDPEVLFNR